MFVTAPTYEREKKHVKVVFLFVCVCEREREREESGDVLVFHHTNATARETKRQFNVQLASRANPTRHRYCGFFFFFRLLVCLFSRVFAWKRIRVSPQWQDYFGFVTYYPRFFFFSL